MTLEPALPKHSAEFRFDINGLRAWAVVAVVLYHFQIPGFRGGFSGVDVFFVISGFLMTGIVVGGLERNRFSVAAFYMARARRIIPALLGLCAVVMAMGWWLLLPVDYKALGSQVAGALVFFSNIQFWRDAGYFDAASHGKWLLHTWSLSVEWQFYLLLPLAMTIFWRWLPGRRSAKLAFWITLAASLAASIVLTPREPSLAFYLLPIRAWEMLAGGLVYLHADNFLWSGRQRKVLEALGMALIAATILLAEESSAWPGWHAVFPVLGAALVLVASCQRSNWTGLPIMQWLGTRSYSLYLWHWPLVVLLSYTDLHTEPMAIAGGLALTLVFGHLSYHGLEVPVRRALSHFNLYRGGLTLAISVLLIAVPAVAVGLSNGISGRFSAEIEQVSKEALNRAPRREECHPKAGVESPGCLFGGNRLRVIVLGDSHADAVVSGVAAAAPEPSDGVMQWSYSACPTLKGVKGIRPGARQCGAFVNWALKQLTQVPSDVPILIVNRHGAYALGPNEDPDRTNRPEVFFSRQYSQPKDIFLEEYANHLIETACEIAKSRTVYLLRPIPEMGVHVPKWMSRSMAWGRGQRVELSLSEYHRRNEPFLRAQDSAKAKCGVRILDPIPYLCHDGKCYGDNGGRPLFYDDNHLSEYGNKLLIPLFAQVFPQQD